MKKENFSKKWDKTMFPVAEWCNANGPKIIFLLLFIIVIGVALDAILYLLIATAHAHTYETISMVISIVRIVCCAGAALFYLFSTWLSWLFKL